jgi:hypothetical protein
MNDFGFSLSDTVVATFLIMAFGLFFGFLFTLIRNMTYGRLERKKLSNL